MDKKYGRICAHFRPAKNRYSLAILDLNFLRLERRGPNAIDFYGPEPHNEVYREVRRYTLSTNDDSCMANLLVYLDLA